MKNPTAHRINQVTQRLDHMVPDLKVAAAINISAAQELSELSEKLASLLPDPSLSPDERLERLARVVETRIPSFEHLQPALAKVNKLKNRIDELVPGNATYTQKIDQLVGLAMNSCGCAPGDLSCVEALEKIGDPRAGIKPVSE